MAEMTQEDTIDYMNMSDAEFEALEESGELVDVEDSSEATDTEDTTDADIIEDTVNTDGSDEESDEGDDSDEDDTPEPQNEPESQDDAENADIDNAETDEDADTEGNEPDTADTTDNIDYKAAYLELMKPFKANGTEIQITSIEDQRALLAKGANYELKMRGIKPVKVLQKTLEDAGIIKEGNIAEDELNFLLDLKNKKPEAIQKLLADANIDPLVDLDEDAEYIPGDHIADEQDILLAEVISEIETSPAYERTTEIITAQWDNQSREYFRQNPNAIKGLNLDIEQGVFDQINSIVQSERVMGRLQGKSDIDAYIEIAKARAAAQAPAAEPAAIPTPQTTTTQVDPTKEAKRKAAGISKSKGASKKSQPMINPLNMSDAEFEKLYG